MFKEHKHTLNSSQVFETTIAADKCEGNHRPGCVKKRYAMKEKLITDTLKANFMQHNASRGRQWACFGIVVEIRCIVVKNRYASWVEIEIFFPCTD